MSSISLKDLLSTLNNELKPEKIKDYCPNGLQVEGSPEINKIITGVTASQALIDEAIALQADAIIVHHGYFWKGEAAEVVGMKAKRLKALLANDISLIAYHLPLDVHPELGNNAELARELGFRETGPLDPNGRPSVGSIGELDKAMTAEELNVHISQTLGRECQWIPGGDHQIKTIAWCTGAAQSMIGLAVEQGVDAFVSGEISEPTVHSARELGIHYFAAGHHATEKGGVKAIARFLSGQGLDCQFVDIDNPV